MATTLPFIIDLNTQRVVYANDILVGVRSITLDKASQYVCPITFNSGSTTGLNPNISGFIYSLTQPSNPGNPIISTANYSSGSFNLNVTSSVLDYIINGSSTLSALSNFGFSGNGINYIISPLATIINNSPTVSPAQEYYPLYSNPSGYVTGINSGDFTSIETLNATGSNLQNQINTIEGTTGNFYTRSNPSGYITGINTGNFTPTTALNATGSLLQGEINSLQGVTGSFYAKSNPSGYITGLNTGNFITTSQTGNYLAKANNLSDVSNAQTARSNIGLYTYDDRGQVAGAVVVLDGSAKLPAIDGSQLTNLGLGTAAYETLDTDETLAADSDSNIPSQKAVKTYVDANAGGGGSLPFTVADSNILAQNSNSHGIFTVDSDGNPQIKNDAGYILLGADSNGNPQMFAGGDSGYDFINFDSNGFPFISNTYNAGFGFDNNGQPSLCWGGSPVNGGRVAIGMDNSNGNGGIMYSSQGPGYSYNGFDGNGNPALANTNNTIVIGCDSEGNPAIDLQNEAITTLGSAVIMMPDLPSSDPHNYGQLYYDESYNVKFSNG